MSAFAACPQGWSAKRARKSPPCAAQVRANDSSAAEPRTGRPDRRVIVVGGGVGGLCTAVRLQRAGVQVELLEKNEQVGGRLCEQRVRTQLGEYYFDTGPSLLLLPDVYRQTFEELGEPLHKHLELLRVEPNYRVFRGERETLDIYSEPHKMREQLERVEAGAGERWTEYIRRATAFFEGGFPVFIERDGWESLRTALRRPDRLLRMLWVGGNPLQSHRRMTRRLFRSALLRGAATFQGLYVGLAPSQAPSVFALLHALESKQGIWYPRGGMSGVRDVLVSLARRNGVNIRTRTRVSRVLTDEHGGHTRRASGVELEDGERMYADAVVINADLPLAERELLSAARTPQEPAGAGAQQTYRYSSAVVNVMLTVEHPCEALAQHNVFLADDEDESWAGIFSRGLHLPADFNMYVHVPSRTDASTAPAQCSSVMCLLPCGLLPLGHESEVGSEADTRLRERALESVMRRLTPRFFTGEAVRSAHVRTPAEWAERCALDRGAAFGLAHNLRQLAVLRPRLRSTAADRLYFVGASTRPGNGVPLVMLSARRVAQLVLSDLAKP